MKHFIKIDFLFLGFVLCTTALLICSWNQTPNSMQLLSIRLGIIGVSLVLILGHSRIKSTTLNFLRNIYPIVFSGYFYTETVHYNKLFFNNLDPYLIRLEQWLFGFQPSLEFSTAIGSPWLTELMYFGYFSFYLIIIGFVIAMSFKRRSLFLEAIFALSFVLFFFYAFFSIFPSAGPQFYFGTEERMVPSNGFWFQNIMHAIQAGAEQPTGAFPSSHVGVTLAILLLAKKSIPLFYKLCIPLAILLILSTIYIKAHYAVDAIAGALIAPIIVYLAALIYKYPSKKETPN